MPTPRELGYRWPAEWEPQRSFWMAWPHDDELWPTEMEPVREQHARLIATLASALRVDLLVPDEDVWEEARAAIAATAAPGARPNVVPHVVPTDDCWLRDSGPIFVQRSVVGKKETAAVGWGFNGWGKFEPYALDNQVPERVAQLLGFPHFDPGVVLEGGGIDGDGAGTCLTTEQCLLQPNRNPGLGKADYERLLRDHLGVEKLVWLGEGMHNDHTDGHVDVVARFAAPGVVVAHATPDRKDPNHAPLADNLARLRASKDAAGKPLRVVELAIPAPVVFEGKRLAASYANFVLAPGIVVAPAYGVATDAGAQATLREVFPDRKVVPLPCLELLRGGGAFHCLTQQQPA